MVEQSVQVGAETRLQTHGREGILGCCVKNRPFCLFFKHHTIRLKRDLSSPLTLCILTKGVSERRTATWSSCSQLHNPKIYQVVPPGNAHILYNLAFDSFRDAQNK